MLFKKNLEMLWRFSNIIIFNGLIDAEFEKIALATNPSIAPDRIKYAKEVADAKIASDVKAAADAKTAADAKIATDMKAFKFNRNASYSTDPVFGRNLIANSKITTQNIVFKNGGDSFQVKFWQTHTTTGQQSQ